MMDAADKKLSSKLDNRIPLSGMLRTVNPDLENKEYDVILFGLDGLCEMLINYVRSHEEGIKRIEFIDSLFEFAVRYRYLTKPENLYVIQIILLNELYKKNQNEPSVLKLLKNEMHFDEKNVAAFKAVIEKELRETCMADNHIPDRKDPRYQMIVKPMLRDFENFYYSFR